MPEIAVIPLALNGRNSWSLMKPEIPVMRPDRAVFPESVVTAETAGAFTARQAGLVLQPHLVILQALSLVMAVASPFLVAVAPP